MPNATLTLSDLTLTLSPHPSSDSPRHLIHGLNAAWSIGDCVLLHGANGCGKSHLLKAIAGLIPIAAGVIAWQGQPLPPVYQRQSLMAWLPQELPDLPHDRVCDVLHTQPNYVEDDSTHAHQAVELYRDFSLDGLLHRPYHQLSGGEKKRVWLCKTLMRSQPIVLLDEPQHHLDVHFQAVLYQTLTKQRPNRLIIMAEHAQLAHHFATPTVLNFDAHLPRS